MFTIALFFLVLTVIYGIWQYIGIILPLTIFFFYSLASPVVMIDNIRVNRSISRLKTEEEGDPIIVTLLIHNSGNRIPVLEIMDNISPSFTVFQGSNHWLLELDQGEEVVLTYSIRCHERGRHLLGPVDLKASDIFHFHTEIKEIPVYSTISVVPSLIKTKRIPLYRQLLPNSGHIPSIIFKGRDFDFQGVRNYQPNDEMRTINWRVTAKYQRLATNEYALDQSASIYICLDHTISSTRVIEEGVKAALSSSEYLISLRNKIGFIGIGEFIEEIPPAIGKRQLLQISEYLIDVSPSYPQVEAIFQQRLNKKLLPSLSRVSQIVFVSPLYNRLILDFLIELVTRDYPLVVIMPLDENGLLREIKNNYPPNVTKIADALLRFDRMHVFTKLANLRIPLLYWYPDSGLKPQTAHPPYIRT
ncbi:MAG: DUF58 domain-containing protein [Candidatus Thorarchaeota archaeon]